MLGFESYALYGIKKDQKLAVGVRCDSDLPQVVGGTSKGWMILAPLENIVDVQ